MKTITEIRDSLSALVNQEATRLRGNVFISNLSTVTDSSGEEDVLRTVEGDQVFGVSAGFYCRLKRMMYRAQDTIAVDPAFILNLKNSLVAAAALINKPRPNVYILNGLVCEEQLTDDGNGVSVSIRLQFFLR